MKKKSVGRVVLGIDPGKSGGLVCLTQGRQIVDYTKMPSSTLDLWNWLRTKQGVYIAYIEKVHAMPGQGVTSMFTFGKGLGHLEMALAAAGIPSQEITPRTWQKGLGITARKKTETKPNYKERLRAKAQKLFPKLDVWNETLGAQRAVCDAMLIAEYGRRTLK